MRVAMHCRTHDILFTAGRLWTTIDWETGVKRRTLIVLGAAGAILAVMTTPVAAQAEDPSAAVQAALDNAWVVLAGVLVFVMQAGFALLESGLTRVKNTTNILAKNLADMCIGALAFLAVGYGLAFGRGNAWWGTEGFFLAGSDLVGVGSSGSGNLTTGAFFFFHAVFAAAAVTIASGAMAERARFKAYLLFSVAMSAFVYPLVVHWTWGGGFIADMSIAGARFSDFAGSTVVHGTGGCAALAGAVFLGPRLGKYTPDGTPRPIAGHAMPMVLLGVFILWLGWFGFNAGSQLAAAADSPVTRVVLNTVIAGAAGTLASGAVVWRRQGLPDMSIIANGTLAGLVSITAGCASMNVLGALATGAFAGVLVVFSMLYIEHSGIDDRSVPCRCTACAGSGAPWPSACSPATTTATWAATRPACSTAAALSNWSSNSSWWAWWRVGCW